jgi:hypothetical protein
VHEGGQRNQPAAILTLGHRRVAKVVHQLRQSVVKLFLPLRRVIVDQVEAVLGKVLSRRPFGFVIGQGVSNKVRQLDY